LLIVILYMLFCEMEIYIAVVFVVGYLAIAFEHPLKINKTAIALITGVLCWSLVALSSTTELHRQLVETKLGHHLSEIAAILFFLMAAMTIVELIDAHEGFRIITDRMATKDVRKLLWLICWITFFLSSVLDNLTTAIVMVSVTRKLIGDREQRLFFCGMVIIAANAGGAFSPIGDVTTTMLWIGGQVSAIGIITKTILPSIVCLLVPLVFLSFRLRGNLIGIRHAQSQTTIPAGGKTMLAVGLGALLFVPLFKSITHLPPYVGMLLGLGVVWVVSEIINSKLDDSARKKYSAAEALSRIDTSSVLFFLGILLAVGALESNGMLRTVSDLLANSIGNTSIIITTIGVLSSIVDNVPLVAAGMGMYPLSTYPQDHALWQYFAYCAGTGGSLLVIGSAAGVAVMGMEKIDFVWYLKKISLLALAGYAAGALVYLLMNSIP
jgi:Na+/H+ antiporter NhaD/arsenite permease-like protein